MFFTRVLFKKAKSKSVLVLLESTVTGHKIPWARERLSDKIEDIRYDPYVRTKVVYKEVKKIKSLK